MRNAGNFFKEGDLFVVFSTQLLLPLFRVMLLSNLILARLDLIHDSAKYHPLLLLG
jgi:hypothetical protein